MGKGEAGLARSVEELESKRNWKALLKMLDRGPDNYEAEKALHRIGDASTAEALIKMIARHAKAYGEARERVQSKEEQAAQALQEATGHRQVFGIGADPAPAERKQAEVQERHLMPLTRTLSCIWSEDQIRQAMARPDLGDKWVQKELESAAHAAVLNWSPRP
jgi:hypothetical protein